MARKFHRLATIVQCSWFGLVAALSPGIIALTAHSQTLNCANVRVNLQTGGAYCADSPMQSSPATTPPPQSAGSQLPSSDGGAGATHSGNDNFSAPSTTNWERTLDQAGYEQLTPGMTLDAVVKQLGVPSRSLDSRQLSNGGTQTSHIWQFQNGQITLYFINNVLTGKSSGLSFSQQAAQNTVTPRHATSPALGAPSTELVTILPSTSVVDITSPSHVFNRLETGIALRKAQTILGQTGREEMRTQTVSGEAIVVYKWLTSQGSITAIFQSDRLVSKSWCGSCSF